MKNTNFTLHFTLGQLNSSAGSGGGGVGRRKSPAGVGSEARLSRRSDLEGGCVAARGHMAARGMRKC